MNKLYVLITMMALLVTAYRPAMGQTLLAGWDFQTAPGTAIVAQPNTQTTLTANFGSGTIYLNGSNGSSAWVSATSNGELNALTGTTINGGTGFSTTTSGAAALALLGGGSLSANGKSLVFTFSMTGYQNLLVSYAAQRTSTGFTSQLWEYSTNGTTWTTVQTITGLALSFTAQTLNTITGLDNASTAYLRLTVTGASGATGNNRLDNIQMNASAIPTSSATDAFRTKASGNWNNTITWESSSNGTTWINATLTPTSAASTITIQNGNTVAATTSITVDETIIASGGVLNINPGVTLSVNNGTAGDDLTVNGSLAFLSDATGTGRLANLGAATIAQNNNVTVQRYIPAKTMRKYDFIASPVTATIASSWQQQIFITGSGTGGTPCANTSAASQPTQHSNGFDATASNSPSFFTYTDTAPYWNSIGGTSSVSLTPGVGYRINVRGNRNDATNGGCAMLNSTSPATPGAVTLSATGTVNTGATNVTVDEAYELLGNPYPSEIDFNAFVSSNASVITGNLWLYNPQRAAGANSYTTYSAGTNTYAGGALPAGYYSSGSSAVIASGQAFFVERNGAGGTATFNETHKTATIQPGMFKTTTWSNMVRVALERANDSVSLDDVVTIFDNTIGSAAYNPAYDAHTINTGTHLAFMKGAEYLAIQSRPEVSITDTVAMYIESSAAASYHLHFTEHQPMNASVYLVDHYTNSIQDVKANPYYAFSTDGNNLSQGASRFELAFVDYTTGVGNVAKSAASVYPNPAGTELNISLSDNKNGNYAINVMDAQGRKVLTQNVSAKSNLLQVNTSSLTPGMYFVEVRGENYLATAKFIK